MNIKTYLFSIVTLFFFSCASEGTITNNVISSTPEEAMTNYIKAMDTQDLSEIKGVVTPEMFDFLTLEFKYRGTKKNEASKKDDEASKSDPLKNLICTTNGEEAKCEHDIEGFDFKAEYAMVQQGENWVVASLMGRVITSEVVAERKDYFENRFTGK